MTGWADQMRAARNGHGPSASQAVRIGSLTTLAGLRREQMRLYKLARRAIGPKPSPEQATKLAYMLSCLYRTTEYVTLHTALRNVEGRIDKLEKLPAASGNGLMNNLSIRPNPDSAVGDAVD